MYQNFVAPAALALLVSAFIFSCNEEKKETTIEKKETIEIKKDSMDTGDTRPVVPATNIPTTPAN